MLRINNIKIFEDISNEEIFSIALKKNRINPKDVINWHISKKSIDARKKDNVHYNYSIDIEVKNENQYKNLTKVKDFEFPKIKINTTFNKRPVIIGAGPGGLFSTC